MYAIVRCGGRQEKATVDEVLTVDTLAGEAGSSVDLPALLVVDDDKVISDPAELSRYQVTAEILGPLAGPKINMIQFKNKTGYRRRLGHRQKYTQVKITSISAGRKTTSSRKTADAGTKAPSARAKATAKAAPAQTGSPETPAKAEKKAPAARKAPATRRTSAASKADTGEKD